MIRILADGARALVELVRVAGCVAFLGAAFVTAMLVTGLTWVALTVVSAVASFVMGLASLPGAVATFLVRGGRR